ncbi:hypothetical protein DN062_17850 [Nitrincola tibetensis]|uniref:Uncharacterized protein n=1 Tax=Nitrincola tibetensis TaxID=2219697 RepID=A0A364NHX3_9GAMM|nr:hypothetical protein DN062_17850 [Nitrincola tibetensis]
MSKLVHTSRPFWSRQLILPSRKLLIEFKLHPAQVYIGLMVKACSSGLAATGSDDGFIAVITTRRMMVAARQLA